MLTAALAGGALLAACHNAASQSERATAGAATTGGVCGAASTAEQCFVPFSNARSEGTGQPGPMPAVSEFNADGCLPKEKVSDGCCNGPADGPRFTNKKCCYTFCVTGRCC
jgi:hypothetical protein